MPYVWNLGAIWVWVGSEMVWLLVLLQGDWCCHWSVRMRSRSQPVLCWGLFLGLCEGSVRAQPWLPRSNALMEYERVSCGVFKSPWMSPTVFLWRKMNLNHKYIKKPLGTYITLLPMEDDTPLESNAEQIYQMLCYEGTAPGNTSVISWLNWDPMGYKSSHIQLT